MTFHASLYQFYFVMIFFLFLLLVKNNGEKKEEIKRVKTQCKYIRELFKSCHKMVV